MKVIKSTLIVLIFSFIFLIPGNIHAHPGRTDAYGGHNCYVGSCAGTYHYHNGGYVEDDYYEQGYEFGSSDALDNNHDYITSNAKNEGKKDGYDVGLRGESEEFSPDSPSWICEDVTFDFRANEYEDYISGVNDGFSESCIELANDVYAEAYSEGYTEGLAVHEENQKDEEDFAVSDTNSTSTNDSGGGWGWLLGLGGFYGAVALIGNWDEIVGWWKKH